MSTKANWFLEVNVPDEDLSEPPHPIVTEIAERMDLRDPEALHAQLRDLLAEENRLFAAGVTCEIRHGDWPIGCGAPVCSACPLHRDDPDDPLSALCAIGRETDRVLTILCIHKVASRPPD